MAEKKTEEIKEVKKATKPELTEEELHDKWLHEPVSIMLFKDADKYSQPLFVSINDKTWLIQRGVQVQIPRYVAMHIQEMQEQDMNTAAMIAQLGSEYLENSKRM